MPIPDFTLRHMYTSDGSESRNASVHNGTESGSRKSSVTTQHTSQIPESVVETQNNEATAQNESVPLAPTETEPLDYDKILEHGSNLVDDPDNAKQWLIDFGHLKKGTDVSLHFINITAQSDHGGPHSLLPLLTRWIPTWYRSAVQRRRVEKLPRSAEYKEQDDFNWLLKYVADYISLGHEGFDQEELIQLCASITKVCQETGRLNVITDSIVILHNIMVVEALPEQVVGSTLEVLCAGTVTLPELPTELFDGIKLLLTGPLRVQALDWLFGCITTPTVQNNSDRLIEARGAIRQVQHHLNITGASDQFAIDLDRFLDSLNQASKCCIFRYCNEVLLACQIVLESDQLPKLLRSDMRTFMGTIENCLRTTLPRNASTRSFEALRSPDRSQVLEHQRQNERHWTERRATIKQLLATFEKVWEHLTSEQGQLVGDFVMDHAKDLNDTQAAAITSHLFKRGLLMPGVDDWSQRTTKVIDSLVRNNRVAIDERVRAAVLCVDTAASAGSAAGAGTDPSPELTLATGKNIVDRLLNIIGKEYNTALVRGILSPLKKLTDLLDTQRKSPYATVIINKLLYFVKTEREGEDDVSDEHILLFTQAIRDIFLRSLHTNPYTAPQAYDALLEIANPRCKSRRCRLAALRLLLRVRCDNEGMIYVTTAFDSEYIAAALCRTEQTRDAFTKELATQQRASSSHNMSSAFNVSARQLWIYPNESSCIQDWDVKTSGFIGVPGTKLGDADLSELDMTSLLVTVIESLQSDNDWETYSFILVHLGAQLFNVKLFSTSLQGIVMLRQVLCEQIHNNSFKEPPTATGLKKSDAALCLFNMLTALIPYASLKSDKIQKGFGDDLVKSFVTGIGNTWDGTHRGCIHALSVCSFMLPASVASSYPSIVQTMGKNMSQSHLTIHILEFLAQVARIPEVHSSFNQNEIAQIFGICLQFLEKMRDTSTPTLSTPSPRSTTPARHSGITLRRPPYRAAVVSDTALPQYASALAYHTMIFWFLSLRLEVRAKYVSWIVPRLVWKNAKGEDVIDEQGQVLIDMMQRTAFSDLGESAPNPAFAKDSDGTISSASWVVGLSIITAETAGHTGLTQITKRQAAGTTYTLYQQLTASTPSHHTPLYTQLRPEEISRFGTTDMLPSHILLQMVSTAAPTSVEDQPIYLPQEDYVTRALNVFDRIPTVDSHKIGVLYIGPGQSRESEYLTNTSTSPEFERFLHGLGYRVSLQPPLRYNPQGLQYPRDGEMTVAWRDRVSEVVYHVPSMMPNHLEDDPNCNVKKAHVGNCHVVVVFNESGLPWKIENFPSQVTLVNVIITPVSRTAAVDEVSTQSHEVEDHTPEKASTITIPAETGPSGFYQVLVVTKENYPNVSPAADPKVISKEMLPAFVRMFSINANLFSTSKVAADSNDGEYPSTWRARLQAIKRLKERAMGKQAPPSRNHSIASGTADRLAMTGGRKAPAVRDEAHNVDSEGVLASQLDFGSWTSPIEKDLGRMEGN